MLALRPADRPGQVDEPVVLLLPELPAAAAPRGGVTGDPVGLTALVSGQVQGVGFRWWTRCRESSSEAVSTFSPLPQRPL